MTIKSQICFSQKQKEAPKDMLRIASGCPEQTTPDGTAPMGRHYVSTTGAGLGGLADDTPEAYGGAVTIRSMPFLARDRVLSRRQKGLFPPRCISGYNSAGSKFRRKPELA
jgi:hypothetical protein